jgi:CRP-like cAMP-binding protein
MTPGVPPGSVGGKVLPAPSSGDLASGQCTFDHRHAQASMDNSRMDTAPRRSPIENRLLSSLPRLVRQRLLASSTQVELKLGEVLYEPAERIRNVYFPLEGFISLLLPVDGHASLELALIGNEGMLGVPVVLGVEGSSLRALVQGSGSALRVSTVSLRGEIERSAALRRTLNRYIHVLLDQAALIAACNSFHTLDARLVRWLLMTHDRAHADHFHLTHEFLAQMLGVRRVGVTNAAGQLQQRKLLRYSRGDITVLDRAGLESASCGCYQLGKDIYERVLS